MRSILRLGGLVLIILGCRSDKLVEPVTPDPAKVYWRLDVNHPAVMLSVQKPYDTVQLVATPVNAYGDPIPSETQAVYRNVVSIDSAVRVDSTGFVTAHYATGATSRIEVSLQIGGNTKIDTVFVMVRNDASVRFIDSVRLRPDSSWRWKGYTLGTTYTNWAKVYAGASEVAASQRVIHYSYDDPALIECGDESFTGGGFGCNEVGETYIYVTMYAYDRNLTDSVLFQRIEPTAKVVDFRSVTRSDGSQEAGFFPKELRIQKGNSVFFFNRAVKPVQAGGVLLGEGYGNTMKTFLVGTTIWGYTDSVDIVFDDPSKISAGAAYGRLRHTIEFFETCFGVFLNCFPNGFISDRIPGNIPAFGHVWNTSTPDAAEADKGWRSRRFSEVGEFRYRSTRFPSATGTIIVTE